MIGLDVKIESHVNRVSDAVDRAAFRSLRQAAFQIMQDARASIETSDKASQPGRPPHTRAKRGRNLRNAIQYSATKEEAVIGPVRSKVRDVGGIHEFGGTHYGADYPERAFMGPALEQNLDRFASDWQGSIE